MDTIAQRLRALADELEQNEQKNKEIETPQGLFTSPKQQIEQVEKWNKERGWGFIKKDFENIKKSIPKQPNGHLVCITLVPYLKTVQETFDELWECTKRQQNDSWRWNLLRSDKDHLRLLEGIKHKKGLVWEVIDLKSDKGKRPMDVRNKNSPHAGILASSALHPNWIKAMNGDDIPCVWAPGYEVNVPGSDGEPWQGVVIVDFDRGDQQVDVYAIDRSDADSDYSVPSGVELGT